MLIFTEQDLPPAKAQLMQICLKGVQYDIVPMHASISEHHLRKTSQRLTEHRHDVYHVVVYNSGNGKFSIGGRLVDAVPGLMVLSSPGEGHSYPPIEKGELDYSEFTFSYVSPEGENLRIPFNELLGLHSGFELDKMQNPLKLNKFQYKSLDRILRDIAEYEKDRSNLRGLRFYGYVSALFAFLSNALAESYILSEKILPDGLNNAKNFIHEHYKDKMDIGKIARIACFSKGHFQREFKRKFGFTPLEYINGYRVSAARNLLRTTSLSCSEIAEKVGFRDIFYFSKVFKKISGASPVEYRRGEMPHNISD